MHRHAQIGGSRELHSRLCSQKSIAHACADMRQHADVELALMQAIPAMAHDASYLPYVNRVLDQLCPPGESCFLDSTNPPGCPVLKMEHARSIFPCCTICSLLECQ